MLQRFWSNIIDEAVGVTLLHAFLRYRDHPPVAGRSENGFVDLHCGSLDKFYQPVPQPVDLSRLANRVSQNSDCLVSDYCFPSAVSSDFEKNDVVWCRHWKSQHADSGLTVVGADGIVQVGARWFNRLASYLAPYGIDTVMMDPPFNHRRTPTGYRPGQLIMGGNFDHQLLVARQAVLDFWTVIKTIQSTGRRVGVVGVSYGGWLALMSSLIAEDLEFVMSLAPPIDLVQILSEGGPVVRAIRRGWGYKDLDWPQIRNAARAIIPSAWQPRIDPRRITLHAARYDRFVPCARIVQLAELWGAGLVIHNGSHCQITTSRSMAAGVAADIRSWNGFAESPSQSGLS